ncbi:MAG: RNA methyltransferase [Atopobiaceae bacterium]|nr:RNA methyltransferase [Atopobiaceae bacterium]
MNVIPLDSVDDERLAVYTQLTNHQLRNVLDPARAVLIAESETVVRVALQAGLEPLSVLIEDRWLPQFEERLVGLLPAGIEVFTLPTEQTKKLTGYRVTRGILCAMRRPALRPVCEVLKRAKSVVVLEEVSDTTNIGAIARNAAALGIDGFLLSPTSADPYARRAIRVSMGTMFQLKIARFNEKQWPQQAFDMLHEAGFSCYALALDEHAYELGSPELPYHEKQALFFGSEGDGLTKEAVNACDYVVKIPMSRGVDSLNVAAASAVACWELVTRKSLEAERDLSRKGSEQDGSAE